MLLSFKIQKKIRAVWGIFASCAAGSIRGGIMQHEVTQAGPLLDEKGGLTEKGYAKKLIRAYDRKAIKGGALRIKEWDYYAVVCKDYAVALTIADNSYMGLMSVSLIDLKNVWEQTTSVMTFMPCGRTGLPADSGEGRTAFRNDRIDISFEVGAGKRRLRCELKDFKDKKPFRCDIELTDPGDESIVMLTPFKEKATAFYYNQKINCMPASGSAEFDGVSYEFKPADSFGTLDWGRGVWTYDNTWYWGSASGMVNGERFGFDIGTGFGDESFAKESMIFYGGKAHKFGLVDFGIPLDENGREKYLEPWRLCSDDGRFDMIFEPIIDRKSYTSVAVIESDQNQVFGRFSGSAVLDDGKRIEVKGLTGFAEKVRNKW